MISREWWRDQGIQGITWKINKSKMTLKTF